MTRAIINGTQYKVGEIVPTYTDNRGREHHGYLLSWAGRGEALLTKPLNRHHADEIRTTTAKEN